jgi:hypothetical protein
VGTTKKIKKRKRRKEQFFELKIFWITIKQIRLIIWISLIIAIFGAINYQGEVFTIKNNSKFITGLNEVVYQALIAYITGFILLFLFDLLPKTKKRISIASSIGNKVLLIKERIDYLLNEIGKRHSNKDQRFSVDENVISQNCATINVDEDIVKVWFYPNYTFRQFVVRSCEEIKIAVNEILGFSDALNEKWTYSLSKIGGASDKVIKSFDIRFPLPKIEFYWVWGLYAESESLMKHLKRFNEDHFKLAFNTAPPFHPIGLTFEVDRNK